MNILGKPCLSFQGYSIKRTDDSYRMYKASGKMVRKSFKKKTEEKHTMQEHLYIPVFMVALGNITGKIKSSVLGYFSSLYFCWLGEVNIYFPIKCYEHVSHGYEFYISSHFTLVFFNKLKPSNYYHILNELLKREEKKRGKEKEPLKEYGFLKLSLSKTIKEDLTFMCLSSLIKNEKGRKGLNHTSNDNVFH